jgi:hypothetical protein
MGFSPRNLSHSLPTDAHSPHSCSTPGVYTFSVTWTVLRLLTSLALGYNNMPDRKSPGSVVAIRFLPRVLSFLCALSHLERIAHRPTSHMQSSTAWPQQPTGKNRHRFAQTGSTITGWSHDHGFWDRDSTHRLALSDKGCIGFPNLTKDFPPFQNCTRVSCRGHTIHAQDSLGRNGGGIPLTAHLGYLFACTRVDTCHPWSCMRSISMHLLCTFSPC